MIDRRRLLAAFASLGNLVDRLLCRGSTDCFGTLSRRWRLKKQTSPDTSNCDPVGLKQPTVSSVATSAITIGIGGPRHLSLFGARPSRAQILGIPLVARALHRLLEHIAQPMPRRIFTIRGVLIPC